jgi:hypothetical protein
VWGVINFRFACVGAEEQNDKSEESDYSDSDEEKETEGKLLVVSCMHSSRMFLLSFDFCVIIIIILADITLSYYCGV